MKKFIDAFNGILKGLNHKSVRIQFILGLLAIIGGFIIRLDKNEWFAFILCIGLIIALEMINTSIEFLCDIVNPKYDEKIKTIKDISSGAVLIASISSLIICLICVFERIL